MNEEEMLQIIMKLISYGGNAKSSSMEAIHAAKNAQFDEANQKLKDADKALKNAHESQTALLTKEASNNPVKLSLLLVHGQDHLMNAITFKDLATEIIDVHLKINETK